MKMARQHSSLGWIRFLVAAGTLLLATCSFAAEATKPVKVFIFAGQSNMEGADAHPERIDDFPVFKGAGAPQTDVLYCYLAGQGQDAFKGWGPLQPLQSFGSELTFARRLKDQDDFPIAIIKSAVGGTTVAYDWNPETPEQGQKLYPRTLQLIRESLRELDKRGLRYRLEGVMWHQGENDQGSDGPTGGYGWETYQQLFVEMSAAWKQDFPNVQHTYVFQIWPNSCSMGGRDGSGDMLREKQRTLPELFSNMSIVSTLGVRPPGGCHFPLAGWAEFARLIQPVIERDHYGKVPLASITPPNLRHASYAGGKKDTITLEFDQPVVWADALAGQFYLDGEKDKVASGSVAGNVLTLKLKEASAATKLTYLKEIAWNQDTLLNGANGLAALTFCNVPVQPAKSAR